MYTSGYPWHNELYAHAVDRKSGKEIWSTDFPVQQALVHGDKVFLVSLPSFADRSPGHERKGKVYAMSLSTGTKAWDLPTVTSRKDVRLLSTGHWLYCLTNEQTIVAIDMETGQIKWQADGPPFGPNQSSTVFADGDRIFLEYPDRSIVEIDGLSGTHKKRMMLVHERFEGERVICVDNNDVVVADSGGYAFVAEFALQKVDGPIRTGSLTSRMVISNSVAYFGSMLSEKTTDDTKKGSGHQKELNKDYKSGSNAQNLVEKLRGTANNQSLAAPEFAKKFYLSALDLESKRYVWNVVTESKVVGTPIVDGGRVFASTEATNGGGTLLAFDAKSGQTLWRLKTTVPIVGFILQDNVIYANMANRMVAVNAHTGAEIFDVRIEKYSMSEQPVKVGDVVYVAAEDSNLYAISVKDVSVEKKADSADTKVLSTNQTDR